MTSSNGNIFRVTGHLCGEFTGHRWISPHKGRWHGALMFSLICVWINDWVNDREAGDLRRNRFHYDVIVMEPVHRHSNCICITRPQRVKKQKHRLIQTIHSWQYIYNFIQEIINNLSSVIFMNVAQFNRLGLNQVGRSWYFRTFWIVILLLKYSDIHCKFIKV